MGSQLLKLLLKYLNTYGESNNNNNQIKVKVMENTTPIMDHRNGQMGDIDT